MRIWDLAKPVIAQVHGYCLAGGSELPPGCDLVYMADDAQIYTPRKASLKASSSACKAWSAGRADRRFDPQGEVAPAWKKNGANEGPRAG